MASAAAGIVNVKFGYAPSQQFHELVGTLPADMFELDPLTLPGLAERVFPLTDHAAWWAERIAGAGGGRWLILSYCSASGFAVALGNALSDLGIEAAVAAFDPVRLSRDEPTTLLREFAATAGSRAEPPGDLDRMPPARALEAGLEYLRLVADPDGELDDAIRDQLVARRAAWLSFALALGADVTGPAKVDVYAFLSRGAEWPADDPAPVDTWRFDVPTAAMMRSAEVTRTLAALLSDLAR